MPDGQLSPTVIGIDLGGTKMLGALADAEGTFLAEIEEPTRNDRPGAVVDQIADLAANLLKAAGRNRNSLKKLAIGVPAAVHPATGLLAICPNVAFPKDEPLSGLLSARLGIPVEVDNDVNMAALGESRRGVGRDKGALAFLAFGTGIGMGLVIGGKVWKGATGKAGEICFLPISDRDPYEVAPTTEAGPYEEAAGSFAIPLRYGDSGKSVRDIFALAASGDVRANAAIDETVRIAAMGVASLLTLIDPDVLVFGGGIGSTPLFSARLMERTRKLLPCDYPMAVSELGPRAGLIGAVEAALASAD